MICPSCGLDMHWVDAEGDDATLGYWECDEQHRWRRSFGGFAPVEG